MNVNKLIDKIIWQIEELNWGVTDRYILLEEVKKIIKKELKRVKSHDRNL